MTQIGMNLRLSKHVVREYNHFFNYIIQKYSSRLSVKRLRLGVWISCCPLLLGRSKITIQKKWQGWEARAVNTGLVAERSMMETIEGVDVAVDFEPFYQFINKFRRLYDFKWACRHWIPLGVDHFIGDASQEDFKFAIDAWALLKHDP